MLLCGRWAIRYLTGRAGNPPGALGYPGITEEGYTVRTINRLDREGRRERVKADERRIHRLRQRMFGYSEADQERAGGLIIRLKARCASTWAHQHATNSAGARYARVMWM